MKRKFLLNELDQIEISLDYPCVIFLKGDLGAGKTTISQHILSQRVGIQDAITSPTYTYYNKYDRHYHFDLYRLTCYDEFFAIGGEDILDNNEGLVLIEWPELLDGVYVPDYEIIIQKTDQENCREIEVIKNKK